MIKVQRVIEDEIEKLDVMEITLLSVEEYEAAKQYIPIINDWWWLRSPGYDTYSAADVCPDGSLGVVGNFVYYFDVVVRPALRIGNLKSLNLYPGDKILDFAGHDWTVIADTMAICDTNIGYCCFRKDWKAPDATVYEKSDVKGYVEDWARKERLID